VLRRRAEALGVETSYWDVSGVRRHAEPIVLDRVVEVLEADAADDDPPIAPIHVADGRPIDVGVEIRRAVLRLADGTAIALAASGTTVALPPDVPYGSHELEVAGSQRDVTTTVVVAPPTMPRLDALDGGSGVFVPAYALWERGAPRPSFAHLAALAAELPARGIDVLSTLPLYAGFLDDPFDPSPYAPISRLHWNEVYVDVDTASGDLVDNVVGDGIDWRSLARAQRHRLLEAARRGDADAPEVRRFAEARPDVVAFARYRTCRPDPVDRQHPAELVTASHVFAQWLADQQLAAVERPGSAALALDLPIGSHPDGFETWAHPERFADGVAVGAPPDEFFSGGQHWGFRPPLPAAGRRSAHRSWRVLVGRAGQHASLLRIDHVMGVHRLWWIPDGMSADQGCYVRYPRDEILAVIAAEAAVAGTTVVGEDLGTVPEEVFDALARWDVLGMYEEQFHLDGPLAPIPARTVAGIRTHDMAPFASAAAGIDLTGRARLLAAELGHDVDPSASAVLDATIERLARSDAYLTVVDLDDLVGETTPHNVPGQVLPSSWRRRLAEPTSSTLDRRDVRHRLALTAERGAP